MSQRPSLAAFLILAAAAAVPAYALIPMASDVVQGILDSRKANPDIASPGVAPDPDPLDKYRGLSIKPTANDVEAHKEWVKRNAALSEAPDTLFERMSEVKTTGAAGLGLAIKNGPARLAQDQFYAYNANGTAQIYRGATAIKTSASGLRTLYQTLSEQDRQLGARDAGLAAAAKAAEASDSSADEAAETGASSAAPSSPSNKTEAQSASAAAQAILPAFGALSGAAAESPAAGQAGALPSSAIAGDSGVSGGGAAAARGAGAKGRLEGFGRGNAGGPNAAALSREGDMPSVKVKGMEDLFNGGSEALKKK